MEEEEFTITTSEQDYLESDNIEAIDDRPEDDTAEDKQVGTIASYVLDKFQKAELGRFQDEQRWLTAYRNYRGVYDPEMTFTDAEKSKVFIKVTKTKVLAAYGQLADVLFGTDKFPLTVEPTTVPEGVAESVHFDMQEVPEEAAGPSGMPPLKPGDTRHTVQERLGPLTEKLAPVAAKLKDGPGTTQTQITFSPAFVAAKNMEKKIQDYLDECHATKHMRKFLFECCCFGTGGMKGPFVSDKEYPKWNKDGAYEPISKIMPQVGHVSIWNAYPDPDANNMSECEYFVERHKLSRSQLRKLKKRPYFRSNSIDLAIAREENYIEKWWEHHIDDQETGGSPDRFEVLEFWGYIEKDDLIDEGLNLSGFEDEDNIPVNIWLCNDEIIRLVLNPFTPDYIPYYFVPYEVNPYSFFGVGVGDNMDDTQTLMNGFMRMAIDNAALSGNLIFEIDEDAMVPGQDMTIYPGKMFRRANGAPGQALFATEYPNVSNQNMQMFDKARQLADESTGMPSFAHGQTGVTGVGRTSSGISMLMSAAHGSIKTVIKNIDDYLLAPLGKSLFHFSMQFDFDESVVGDLEVKARGTESLMANEVRSQRLLQFLSIVQTPVLAPFAKMDYILREIAKSMDVDPDKAINSLSDAALQAEVLKKFQATMMPPDPAGAPGAPPSGVPPVSDASGGGGANIGSGTAPVPGEQGFTGNPTV